jgi:hypothetical protein
MADWGAGYANAASGLASIFMGKAQQNVRGREQAAEQARMLKEQKRQEMQELRKMGFQREMQESDRAARMGLMKQEQAFRKEESAAERALRERQLAQNEAYNQGQLGLQARGLSLREQEMEMMRQQPAQGISTTRIAQVINSKAVKDKTTPEEQYEAARQIDPAVADAAFPAMAARRQGAAQTVGRVVTGVEDLLNKYLNQ